MLGGACRVRVLRSLRQRFSSPEAAETFFTGQSKENVHSPQSCEGQHTSPTCTTEGVSSTIEETVSSEGSFTIESVDVLQQSLQQVSKMKPEDQIQFISEVFALYCSSQKVTVPMNFLELAVKGMKQLESAGRTNIVYGLCKGLGTMRSDGSDTVFPRKQVVTGLVEHCVNFFSASYGDQVLDVNFSGVISLYRNLIKMLHLAKRGSFVRGVGRLWGYPLQRIEIWLECVSGHFCDHARLLLHDTQNGYCSTDIWPASNLHTSIVGQMP